MAINSACSTKGGSSAGAPGAPHCLKIFKGVCKGVFLKILTPLHSYIFL